MVPRPSRTRLLGIVSLSVNARVAVRNPVWAGAKLTVRLQACCGARVIGGSGQPAALKVNSGLLEAIAVITRLLPPEFLNATELF